MICERCNKVPVRAHPPSLAKYIPYDMFVCRVCALSLEACGKPDTLYLDVEWCRLKQTIGEIYYEYQLYDAQRLARGMRLNVSVSWAYDTLTAPRSKVVRVARRGWQRAVVESLTNALL